MKVWYDTEEENLHFDGERNFTLTKNIDGCIKMEENNFPEYLKNQKMTIENFWFYIIENNLKNKFKAWWEATKYIFSKSN